MSFFKAKYGVFILQEQAFRLHTFEQVDCFAGEDDGDGIALFLILSIRIN